MKTLKFLLFLLFLLGVANTQAQNNQIFVVSKEVTFYNNTIIRDLKLGGDSVFLITSDPNGRKIIILDSNLRKVDTIKQNFIPGAYYAPRIAVLSNGKGILYRFSDDSLGYLYLYPFLDKSWRLILERPKINSLFLMRDKYFIFGDSLYKIESNFNVTPIAKIERPLLIDSFGDENDSTVIFSYTSADRCVNLVTVNKFNENVEKRKICFGSQFSYSDNVTLSPKGKIYFSIVDSLSITRSPGFMLVIKVFEMNDIRSNPELLYIYIGAADSSSLLCRQTAFKYHNNFIYGAGYTQFLGYYSTFFVLFNIQTKNLQSYIRRNDNFKTFSGEFGRRLEYFSCESGNGPDRIRKYVLDPTSVDDLNQSRYEYVLYQNYPNPFNPITKIKYEIKESGLVSLRVLNALGQEVKLIDNEYKEKGVYEIEFDASKYGLSSGVYLYQLITKNQIITKKMILVK